MVGKRYEIRLAGQGGQGLILAGLFLAEAAALYEGKYVVQSQSYAPYARGGASASEVVISDEEIDYPRVVKPNLIVALSQEAYDRHFRDLQKNGILIVDSSTVEHVDTSKAYLFETYMVPITEIARQATGKEMTASMVALGAISGLTGLVSGESIMAAIATRAPKGTVEINKRAVQAGIEVGNKLREGIGRE
ncbi:MAG: 2-oxoacid:acceptor oxidoreductase family protein [Chloroflexi bacterium]|nr:2-oxoacid:acceptor oxidoreductase family protein [Chloroflexota bacterium]MDA8188831.1 2-oxoacid:acceptor oxidoreductase family protein [Dehalococcoidales bacterium]